MLRRSMLYDCTLDLEESWLAVLEKQDKGVTFMKTVLWISRHKMTDSQQNDLMRICGGEYEIDQWQETVTEISMLMPRIEKADIIAAVLPPVLLSELVSIAGDKPVIQAVSGRQFTGKTIINANGTEEKEFMFVHLYWEQIIKLVIETKRL